MENNTSKPPVTYSDFAKLDLRVALVKDVSLVENSEKLLKLVLDVGGESRQILAGIKKHYSKEELVGKRIVIVANLEPKKLAGEISNGMLLAAEEGEDVVLIIPEKETHSGAPIH